MCEANPDMFEFYLACAFILMMGLAPLAWEMFGTKEKTDVHK